MKLQVSPLCLSTLLVVIQVAGSYSSDPPSTTIFLVGRSGSGISSTVRQLLGNATIINTSPPSLQTSYILKYTISIREPDSNASHRLDIVDVEGFVDGRTSDEDDAVAEAFSEFIKEERTLPASLTFVIISNFDDGRYGGEYSVFVRVLQRIRILQEECFLKTNTSSVQITNILHFNRLMGETKPTQRLPKKKLRDLKETGEQETGMTILHASVGENRVEEYNLQVTEAGMIRLPNKELYPLNLLQIIANGSSITPAMAAVAAFIQARNSSTISQKELLYARKTPFHVSYRDQTTGTTIVEEDEVYSLEEDLTTTTTTTTTPATTQGTQSSTIFSTSTQSSPPPFDDVNNHTRGYCRNLDNNNSLTFGICTQISLNVDDADRLLQFLFRQRLADDIDSLPKTAVGKARLFQTLSQDFPTSWTDYILPLKEAVGLEQPVLTANFLVGAGYDVRTGAESGSTPFVFDDIRNWVPSPIGYRVPSQIVVSLQNSPPSISRYAFIFNNTVSAARYKITLLNQADPIRNYSATFFEKYEGQSPMGFNVRDPTEPLQAYSCTIEFARVNISLNLKAHLTLNKPFVQDVLQLTALNVSSKASVDQWKSFFRIHGTHVVVASPAGGYVQGSIFSEGLASLDGEHLEEIATGLTNFSSHNSDLVGEHFTYYASFGGDRFPTIGSIHELTSQEEKQGLLSEWEESLKYNPIPLPLKLKIARIPLVVRSCNATKPKAGIVRKAYDEVLKGRLEYVKPGKTLNTPSSTKTTPTHQTTANTTATTSAMSSGSSSSKVHTYGTSESTSHYVATNQWVTQTKDRNTTLATTLSSTSDSALCNEYVGPYYVFPAPCPESNVTTTTNSTSAPVSAGVRKVVNMVDNWMKMNDTSNVDFVGVMLNRTLNSSATDEFFLQFRQQIAVQFQKTKADYEVRMNETKARWEAEKALRKSNFDAARELERLEAERAELEHGTDMIALRENQRQIQIILAFILEQRKKQEEQRRCNWFDVVCRFG